MLYNKNKKIKTCKQNRKKKKEKTLKMDLIGECELNNVEEVRYYLDAHPEAVNQMFTRNLEEATPLHFAAQYGHLTLVNLLLKVCKRCLC